MAKKDINEILTEVANAPTEDDKINILKFNSSLPLQMVIQGAFHPGIQWVINEPPKYRASSAPAGLGYQTISSSHTKFYLWRKDNPDVSPNVTQERKEILLIQLLESMEEHEAETTVNMMLKDLKVPGLTYSVAKKAFPELF